MFVEKIIEITAQIDLQDVVSSLSDTQAIAIIDAIDQQQEEWGFTWDVYKLFKRKLEDYNKEYPDEAFDL